MKFQHGGGGVIAHSIAKIQVGTVMNEVEANVQEIVHDGDHQRGTPIVVLGIDISSILMQYLNNHRILVSSHITLKEHDIFYIVCAGKMQRRLTVLYEHNE